MLILTRVRAVGFGIAASSSHDGTCSTGTPAIFFVHDMPNLDIWIHERVTKMLFEKKKAIGVEAVGGKRRQTC
jgi:hypothetical protein